MPQFRKKPVVVEATQFFPNMWPYPAGVEYDMFDYPDGGQRPNAFRITTLEGVMAVSPGDWIITGVKGERYPCKPDIFAATYEAVEEGEPSLSRLARARAVVTVSRTGEVSPARSVVSPGEYEAAWIVVAKYGDRLVVVKSRAGSLGELDADSVPDEGIRLLVRAAFLGVPVKCQPGGHVCSPERPCDLPTRATGDDGAPRGSDFIG